jgi:hypothetical protein
MSDELGVLLSLRRCASALQAVDDAAGSAGSGAADGAAAGIVAAQGACVAYVLCMASAATASVDT